MASPKILAFAGSVRQGSYNRMLLHLAADTSRRCGAEVSVVSLNDYPLPLYNEDLEREGSPENAVKLKQLFVEHHGILVSTPEYNSSLPPLLKNTLDWVSRPLDGDSPLEAYRGKTAALLATSPGQLGGLRGLVHLRSILSNIGVLVVPEQLAVARASEAFDEMGNLQDAKLFDRLHEVCSSLVETLKKLHARETER